MKLTDFGTPTLSPAAEDDANDAPSEAYPSQREGLVQQAKNLTQATAQTAITHVVDDDESFARAICRLLKASGHTVRSYTNAGDFLLAEIPDTAGCILLDLCLPGPSGIELQATLARRRVPLPVVFLSGVADVSTSVLAMKGGAMDVLLKPIDHETLLQAVTAAIARSVDLRVRRDEWHYRRTCYQTLTKREVQVFERVVAGKMNKEIAGELGASERTIKAHRARIIQKMHASSVAELVRIAIQLGRDAAGIENTDRTREEEHRRMVFG
jgi:FixJ family two-component response regulator